MVFKSERNMQIHLIVAFLVVIAGSFFGLSITEWCLCFLCFGLVMGAEMINTAIESVVDLASPQKHKLAGKAKDIAAGAVLICAIISACIGLVIFVPKIINFFPKIITFFSN